MNKKKRKKRSWLYGAIATAAESLEEHPRVGVDYITMHRGEEGPRELLHKECFSFCCCRFSGFNTSLKYTRIHDDRASWRKRTTEQTHNEHFPNNSSTFNYSGCLHYHLGLYQFQLFRLASSLYVTWCEYLNFVLIILIIK